MRRSRLSAARRSAVWTLAALLLLQPSLRAAVWKGKGPDAPRPAAGAREDACARLREAGLSRAEAEDKVSEMAPEEVAHAAAPETRIRHGGDYTVALIVAAALVALYFYFSRPPPAFHNPGPVWLD